MTIWTHLTEFKNWVNLEEINVTPVINETDTSVRTERTGRCARQPLQTHLIKSNLAMGRATKIRRSCKGAYTRFRPAGTEDPPSGQQFWKFLQITPARFYGSNRPPLCWPSCRETNDGRSIAEPRLTSLWLHREMVRKNSNCRMENMRMKQEDV